MLANGFATLEFNISSRTIKFIFFDNQSEAMVADVDLQEFKFYREGPNKLLLEH